MATENKVIALRVNWKTKADPSTVNVSKYIGGIGVGVQPAAPWTEVEAEAMVARLLRDKDIDAAWIDYVTTAA